MVTVSARDLGTRTVGCKSPSKQRASVLHRRVSTHSTYTLGKGSDDTCTSIPYNQMAKTLSQLRVVDTMLNKPRILTYCKVKVRPTLLETRRCFQGWENPFGLTLNHNKRDRFYSWAFQPTASIKKLNRPGKKNRPLHNRKGHTFRGPSFPLGPLPPTPGPSAALTSWLSAAAAAGTAASSSLDLIIDCSASSSTCEHGDRKAFTPLLLGLYHTDMRYC